MLSLSSIPPRAKNMKSDEGFTYIGALVLVMVMSISLSSYAKSWSVFMKRERETELLFRGNQIRDAIIRWNDPLGGKRKILPLKDLKDLLEDPYSLTKTRYLRKLYKDPITNGDFEVITDRFRGIIGVRSRSIERPLRQDFMSSPPQIDKDSMNMYRTFQNKEKYSDWAFVIPNPKAN